MAKINTKKPKSNSEQKAVNVDTSSMEPRIDFRYLHESNRCWKYVYKKRNNKVEFDGFCDSLQLFVRSFAKCETIGEALKTYSSHKNGKKVKPSIDVSFLPKEAKESARGEITHLHLKPGGNGTELIWGFCVGNQFFIIAFDPDHELIGN